MNFRIFHAFTACLAVLLSFGISTGIAGSAWMANGININDDAIITVSSDGVSDKVKLVNVFLPDRADAHYSEARQYLESKIINKLLTLKPCSIDGSSFVCEISSGELSINREILERGLAWYFPKYNHPDDWIRTFNEAKALKIGIWSQPEEQIIVPIEIRNEILKDEYLKKLRSLSTMPFYLYHNPYSGGYRGYDYSSKYRSPDASEARRADDYKARYLKGGKVEDLVEYQKAYRNAIGY